MFNENDINSLHSTSQVVPASSIQMSIYYYYYYYLLPLHRSARGAGHPREKKTVSATVDHILRSM